MKKVLIRPEIEAPGSHHGDIVIVQPDEDLVPPEKEFEFSVGDQLEVEIPGADGSVWQSTGIVIGLDVEEGFSDLLMVQIDYGQATLVG